MSQQAACDLVARYYALFNAGDREGFLALLTDDVAHDINQGGREIGRDAFRLFLQRMDRCYSEQLKDIVVMADASGTRAAAEFIVHGTYLSTDDGLPDANGQTYVLPAGAFFEIRDSRVARITNYYNLEDWMKQVAG
ncbi:ketosteroid isomerase-related protein [Acetobacter sp.]|uniref:ketosteroid isomerase-related protein n=1 Tax=Acetobacter sp. TaxID=440 RepID=UPI0039E7B2C6